MTGDEVIELAHELILAMRDTDVEHWDTLEKAAAELRRLHALNAELVEALRSMLYDDDQDEATCKARAALAKVEASK